jgi:hypothetical protein
MPENGKNGHTATAQMNGLMLAGEELRDFDTLIRELGATYPLLAFSADMPGAIDTGEERLDPQILAGLVTP